MRGQRLLSRRFPREDVRVGDEGDFNLVRMPALEVPASTQDLHRHRLEGDTAGLMGLSLGLDVSSIDGRGGPRHVHLSTGQVDVRRPNAQSLLRRQPVKAARATARQQRFIRLGRRDQALKVIWRHAASLPGRQGPRAGFRLSQPHVTA